MAILRRLLAAIGIGCRHPHPAAAVSNHWDWMLRMHKQYPEAAERAFRRP